MFRGLFCRHEYIKDELLYYIGNEGIIGWRPVYKWRCIKCGKVKIK